ncbi:Sodium/calcium exchanger membrane region [Penicillium chermesinum]|nr:Sodium/calcium exchanger membrane region [Penicillium chermesinum]
MHFKKLLRPDPTEQYSRVTAVPEDIPCALCDSTTLAFRKQGRKLFQIKHIISITFAIVTIFISACPSPAILVFILNLIAIVPLSITLTLATEQLSHDLGETTGALLNITIGNLAELIIFATALMKDNIKVVQASLLGSILVNLLLVLGSAIIAGGILSPDQTYNNDLTQSYVGLLNLTVACLMIPTAFYGSVKSIKSADHMSLAFSRGVSVILLIIYFLYLFFQFNTHKHLFRPRAAGIQVADIPAERHAIRSSLEELFGDIESKPIRR